MSNVTNIQYVDLDFGALYNVSGYAQKGVYDSSASYSAGDVVTFEGSSFVAKKASQDVGPRDEEYWGTVAVGMYFYGDYVPNTTYYQGNVVNYEGATYIAKETTEDLPDTVAWMPLLSKED